jgi:predicted nuclease of restriction endonuclease-like (RecB) superfamily
MTKAIEGYAQLLKDIRERIRTAQYEALRAVNKELVSLYWDIGRIILEQKQDQGRGNSLVQGLADDLQQEFPGIKGFSASNLWRMKSFYETYSPNEKLAPLVREIGWSHNLIILERCNDLLEREFYLRMTKKFGWSKNVLIHQIENQSYEKTLLGQLLYALQIYYVMPCQNLNHNPLFPPCLKVFRLSAYLQPAANSVILIEKIIDTVTDLSVLLRP